MGQPEHAPQNFATAADTGIHAVIENRVVDSRRLLVAPLRVPIFFPVYDPRFIKLHSAHVGGCRIYLHVSAIVFDSDAEIGRTAGIARMIRVTALVNEQER